MRGLFKNIFRQGRLGRLNDKHDTQVAQVELFADEVVDEVERIQNYGFTSLPTEGGVYAIPMGGKGNQLIIVAINDDKTRLRILPGEVAIYHAEGHHVVLKEGGVIEANCTTLIATAESSATIKTASATIDSPETKMTGNAEVVGNLTIGGGIGMGGAKPVKGRAIITGILEATEDVIADGISSKGHDHGGVQTGSGNSGKPNK